MMMITKKHYLFLPIFLALLFSCSGSNEPQRDEDGVILKSGQFYDNQEAETGKVWICTGGSSHAYHSSEDCYGLQSCRRSKKQISIDEAIRIGRTPCHYCHEASEEAHTMQVANPVDNISNLYNAIRDKYDIGTEADFRNSLNNAQARKNLYMALCEEYDLGTEEDFNKSLGYGDSTYDGFSTMIKKMNEKEMTAFMELSVQLSEIVTEDPVIEPDFARSIVENAMIVANSPAVSNERREKYRKVADYFSWFFDGSE